MEETTLSSPVTPTRRQEYAAATRAAIVQAGRELFAEQGFIGTKVEDIAARARVSPATVYTSVGGKHAVLRVLLELLASWRPRDETFAEIGRAQTSHEVLLALAHGTRTTREEWADVQRILIETAAHDQEAAAVQADRIQRYKSALDQVIDRLVTLEGPTFDRAQAAAILWFYFGPSAYAPLHDELGWSYAKAERWLLAHCEQALGNARR
jgi:AcrR family transcriptional regulator